MNRPLFALFGIVFLSSVVLAVTATFTFDAKLDGKSYELESFAAIELSNEPGFPKLAKTNEYKLRTVQNAVKKSTAPSPSILVDDTDSKTFELAFIIRVKQDKKTMAYYAKKSATPDLKLSFPSADFSKEMNQVELFYPFVSYPEKPLATRSQQALRIGWAYGYADAPKILVKIKPAIYDAQAYNIIEGKNPLRVYAPTRTTQNENEKLAAKKQKDLKVMRAKGRHEATYPPGTESNVFFRSETPPAVVSNKPEKYPPAWDGRTDDSRFIANGEYLPIIEIYEKKGRWFVGANQKKEFNLKAVKVLSGTRETGQFNLFKGEKLKFGDYEYEFVGTTMAGNNQYVEMKIFDTKGLPKKLKDMVGGVPQDAFEPGKVYMDTTLSQTGPRLITDSKKFLGKFMITKVETDANVPTIVFTVSQPFILQSNLGPGGNLPTTPTQTIPPKPTGTQTQQGGPAGYDGGLNVEECRTQEGHACYSYSLDRTYDLTEKVDKKVNGMLYQVYSRRIGQKSGTYAGVTNPLPRGNYFVTLEGRAGNKFLTANNYVEIKNEYLRKAFDAAKKEHEELKITLVAIQTNAMALSTRFTDQDKLNRAIALSNALSSAVNPRILDQVALENAQTKLSELKSILDDLATKIASISQTPAVRVPTPVGFGGAPTCFGDEQIVSIDYLRLSNSFNADRSYWISKEVKYKSGSCLSSQECTRQTGTHVLTIKQACPQGRSLVCCHLGRYTSPATIKNPDQIRYSQFQNYCAGLTRTPDTCKASYQCTWKVSQPASCTFAPSTEVILSNDDTAITNAQSGTGLTVNEIRARIRAQCENANTNSDETSCKKSFSYFIRERNTDGNRVIRQPCMWTPEVGLCEVNPIKEP